MSRIGDSALRPLTPHSMLTEKRSCRLRNLCPSNAPPHGYTLALPATLNWGGPGGNIVNVNKKLLHRFTCEIVSVNSPANKSEIVKTRTHVTQLKQ